MTQALTRPVVPINLELLQKLSKDVKQTATNLTKNEARYLVDLYYQIQNFRIAVAGQVRNILKPQDPEAEIEPCETLKFFFGNFEQLEKNMVAVLDVYTDNDPVGRWCKSIIGVGPVISAGLIANLNLEEHPTAGHFWSYCGLNDANRPWLGKEKTKKIVDGILGDKKNKDITYEDFAKCCEATKWKAHNVIKAKDGKGKPIFIDGDNYTFTKDNIIKQLAKRPYNDNMKVLCWKMAQCFVKVQNNPKDIYGKLYVERKLYEQQKNENGDYKEQAAKSLARVGKNTETYKWNVKGMLSPAHINRRAERWMTRIFLSHLHQVMYMVEYGTMPAKPYAIEHMGHSHEIQCPNLEVILGA